MISALFLILQKSLQTLFWERKLKEKSREIKIYLIYNLKEIKFVSVLSAGPSFFMDIGVEKEEMTAILELLARYLQEVFMLYWE